MKTSMQIKLALLTLIYMTQNCHAKIMRNNALMNKMISHFQKDNAISVPQTVPPEDLRILGLLQKVLCKNFPSIPCNVIIQDEKLKKLMERSVQQVAYNKKLMDKTTIAPSYDLSLFPVIKNEDLSTLQVSNPGYFKRNKKRRNNEPKTLKNFWSHEKLPKKKIKGTKDSKHTELYTGRKKIRKFYPHKIKYKDKSAKKDFRDYSDEKLSMSVEVPDIPMKNSNHLAYKVDSDDPPVWRIDYTKHGEPSLNMFAYEDDRLRGKIMQTGPNVVVDDNVLEHARKEVLHPDVYIKKTFNRKGSVDGNMDDVD